MNKVNITKTTDNLVIATDQMNDVETIAVSVLVKTGSRDERKKENGISHFLEHMAFKGTENRTARQIAEEFDMIGGHFNAYTSKEKTVYYAKVLKDNIETAVDILSDIIQHSVFIEKELERERQVILQELAMTRDTPDDIIFDYFQETAFPDQAIGRPILGTERFINAVTRADIIDYVNRKYSYDNMIVTAAGNVTHDRFLGLVEEKFTRLPKKAKKNTFPSLYKGGDKRVQKDLEQVHIILGFEGVSYLSDDFYKQQILSLILGGGMSSRLFQEIREKRGLAYSISSYTSSYFDSGIFGIYSGVDKKNVNELLDVVSEQLYLTSKSINENELKRAKAQVKAALLMSQESSVARAEKLSSNYATFKRYVSIKEILEKINVIDINAIQDMIKSILTSKNSLTFATIGNVDSIYNYDTLVTKYSYK